MTPAALWREVGEGVFRRRYHALDLNVGAVLGDGEVLLIDTRSWRAEAEELRDDLRALTSLPCRQVLNTHAHFDHCFGAVADLCRRVLAGEMAPDDAFGRGPYPAETVRMALERARVTTGRIDSTGPPL